jgi:hypothetical protein
MAMCLVIQQETPAKTLPKDSNGMLYALLTKYMLYLPQPMLQLIG